jgi:ABC-type enterobactin transport system permease subunit
MNSPVQRWALIVLLALASGVITGILIILVAWFLEAKLHYSIVLIGSGVFAILMGVKVHGLLR